MCKYRYLVLTDLDGTLLNSEGRLSKSTIDFVHQLNKRNDILFAYSTGRGWEESKDIYETLQLKGFVSCCNGAFFYDPIRNVKIYSFLAKSVWESILSNDDYFKNLNKGGVYSDKGLFHIFPNTDRIGLIKKLKELDANVMDIKTYFEIDSASERSLDDRLNFLKSFESRVSAVLFKHEGAGLVNLEVQTNTSSKAQAARFFSNYYDVKLENILTFGDQINDVSVARGDSFFTAVRNAIYVVKQESNKVSKFSNDEDAVIKELNCFLEKNNFFR